MEQFNPILPEENPEGNFENQEQNPGLIKFKAEFEKMADSLEDISRRLKQRQGEGFTDFMQADEMTKLSHISELAKRLDIFSSDGLENAHQLLEDADKCIGSIDMIHRGAGTVDDGENLQYFAWDLKNLSDMAGALDSAAKRLNNGDAARSLFLTSNSLSQNALEKAEYIASRASALDSYSR